jgi:Fe-S-cluster formation regulator IscX/YfhJ
VGGQSILRMDLYETEADLRDPRQVSDVDLKKLIMSNNLEKEQKEKLKGGTTSKH